MDRIVAVCRKLLFVGIIGVCLVAFAIGFMSTTSTKAKNTAYEDGIKARMDGKGLTDNPFPNDPKHESWERGFEGKE